MNYKLTILKIAAIALMLCAPAMGESTKSFQLPALQAVLFPAVGSLAIQSQSSQSPTKRQPTKRQPLEDKLNRKFVLVLKLDDNQISKLRLEGSLITRIPPKFVNRVGKIRFQPTRFWSDLLTNQLRWQSSNPDTTRSD